METFFTLQNILSLAEDSSLQSAKLKKTKFDSPFYKEIPYFVYEFVQHILFWELNSTVSYLNKYLFMILISYTLKICSPVH